MTRKEIREGIAKITGNRPNPREIDYETADIVMGFLASQGVVIKVDRELPNDAIYRSPKQEVAYCDGRDTVIQAGYSAWKPLV